MFGTSFSVRLLLKGMVTPPEEFFPRSLRQELSAINVYLSVFEERADALHANFAAKSFDEHSLYALHYLLKPLKLFQHCICIIGHEQCSGASRKVVIMSALDKVLKMRISNLQVPPVSRRLSEDLFLPRNSFGLGER
ncbi:hypothetical protein KCU70_g422, partial [Aureobasidium melanogenum]